MVGLTLFEKSSWLLAATAKHAEAKTAESAEKMKHKHMMQPGMDTELRYNVRYILRLNTSATAACSK